MPDDLVKSSGIYYEKVFICKPLGNYLVYIFYSIGNICRKNVCSINMFLIKCKQIVNIPSLHGLYTGLYSGFSVRSKNIFDLMSNHILNCLTGGL